MAQRTIASFFKAPAAKPAGGAVPLRELTESDVNTRKREAPHGDGGCVVDHDERAPRGKRLSAPRSFEKGADVVSVPGTSGGTVSRPGDRPTRSLELVVVDVLHLRVHGRREGFAGAARGEAAGRHRDASESAGPGTSEPDVARWRH